LYFAAVKDSNKWYWSNVLDPTTWDALSFASAEAKPDMFLDIKPISDFLFLIGAESIERWANTGDADAPYSRVEGTVIQRGALATGCSTELNDNLFFVGNDGIVYRLGQELDRLSDHGIEEVIAKSVHSEDLWVHPRRSQLLLPHDLTPTPSFTT
jgi:hypothetical protein